MTIQLPTLSEVEHSVAAWRVEHPLFDALLSQQVETSAALRLFGLSLWREGQPSSAISLLTASAALAPDAASIWGDLGVAYYKVKRLEEAQSCMVMSLDQNSAQPAGWLLLAMIHGNAHNDGEAEAAFLRALELAPLLASASAGLGLLYFRRRRFEDAADRLRTAVSQGDRIPFLHACLGQALYLIGDFPGSGDALAIAARLYPDDMRILKKLALVRLIETVVWGDAQEAVAVYKDIAGPHAEDLATVTRTAFHALSAHGHRDAAIKLGHARRAWAPNDQMQSYLLAALNGEPLSRAPNDYIIEYFNLFAETFDTQLVDVLCYHVPEALCNLLVATDRFFMQVLDLGCGTGLAGPLLRSLGGVLTGIDLSRKMLDKAAERGVYDELIEDEMAAFLKRRPGCFDLIFATDVLIYQGDLSALMAHVARSLRPNGLFAFSIEVTDGSGYVLLPSGRFAHTVSYIEELALDKFSTVQEKKTMIRLEANRPVDGVLFILQRL